MKRFKLSCFFIALAILIAISALIIWIVRSREIRELNQAPPAPAEQAVVIPGGEIALPDPGLEPAKIPESYGDANDLIAGLTKALNDGDADAVQRMLGASVDQQTLGRMMEFAAQQKQLGRPLRVREVGEIKLNHGSRWAIEGGTEDDPARIYLDVKKGEKGWEVEKVTLPGLDPAALIGADSLAVAEAFLQAVLAQRFEDARQLIDPNKVSDARIAGLCILFEEGNYRMREHKPLRLLVQRDVIAAYLANVVSAEGAETAQFALNLIKQGDGGRWLVTEINLDQLLADYAKRVAGGDVYYSPLVKNPKGGETLALYFGFDDDDVSPRTKRQLEIVAGILKADPVKKLTLSGHTDAKGTDDYNRGLSLRRAEVVRDFLIASGVQAQQVVALGMGDSQPRRPNVTETGEDNPDGRKVNRRTEIYLDF